MEAGTRQKGGDATFDHLAAAPGHEDEHIVRPQHARGGLSESEIVVERLGRFAKRHRGDDIHAALPRTVAQRELLDLALEADEKDAPRGDAAALGAAFDQQHEAGALHIERDEADDIEHHESGARGFLRRLDEKAEGQRAQHGHAPEDEAAPAVSRDGEIVRDRIFVAHHIRDHEQDRDEKAQTQIGQRQPVPAVDERVIERLAADRAPQNDCEIEQRRHQREGRAHQGRVLARHGLGPAATAWGGGSRFGGSARRAMRRRRNGKIGETRHGPVSNPMNFAVPNWIKRPALGGMAASRAPSSA